MIWILFLLQFLSFVFGLDIENWCCSAESARDNVDDGFRAKVHDLMIADPDPDHRRYFMKMILQGKSLTRWCDWNVDNTCPSRKKRSLGGFKLVIQNELKFISDFFVHFDKHLLQILVHESDVIRYSRFEWIHIYKWFWTKDITLSVRIISDSKPNEEIDRKGGWVSLSDLSKVASALSQFERMSAMTSKDLWLISGNLTNVPNKLRLQFNSNVYQYHASTESKNEMFALQEVYRVAESSPLKVNPVGVWTDRSGLVMTQEFIWDRRKNLDGLSLHCAFLDDNPWVVVDQETSEPVGGYSYALWMEFVKALNLSFTLTPSIDGGWGTEAPDGTFNGLIGMIQREEVSCALAGFGLYTFRTRVADYLNPITYWKGDTFIKAGGQGDGSKTYLQPFTTLLYFSVIIMCLACSLGFYTTVLLGPKAWEDYDFDLGLSIMVNLHGLLLQGAPYEPKKFSSRIIFGSVFYAGVIILAAYSASLTSILAVHKEVLPFTDFQSLFYGSSYDMIFIQANGYSNQIKTGSEVQKLIYDKRHHPVPSFKDALVTLAKVPELAFYGDPVAIISNSDDGGCSFKKIPGMGRSGPSTLYFAKNFSYIKLFNHQLSNFQESGELDKLTLKWIPQENKLCHSNDAKVLGMDKLYTLFIFLAISLLGSLLLLLLELALSCCTNPLLAIQGRDTFYQR